MSNDDENYGFAAWIVMFFAKIILLIFWCTIGLAIWIAMVLRTMAATTTVSIIALIGRGSLKRSFKTMDYIASIWPRGLHQIITMNQLDGNEDDESSLNMKVILRFAQETAYSVFFFGAIYVAFFGFPQVGLGISLNYKFVVLLLAAGLGFGLGWLLIGDGPVSAIIWGIIVGLSFAGLSNYIFNFQPI